MSNLSDNTTALSQLGSNTTKYKYDSPSAEILETFENKNPDADYMVELIFPEFTSLCPKTGQPDFAKFIVRYRPDKKCLESKSIKLYFFSYRNCGAFMETITNQVLKDFVSACSPRFMEVIGQFNARGGLVINVVATYDAHSKEIACDCNPEE